MVTSGLSGAFVGFVDEPVEYKSDEDDSCRSGGVTEVNSLELIELILVELWVELTVDCSEFTEVELVDVVGVSVELV